MKITVYVPCRNNEGTVGEVFEGLRRQKRLPDQYIFVDDHCSDRSPEIARENGFDVLKLEGAGGLAAGRNLALRHATGDILLGIDADAVLAPDYLEEMEKRFAAHPGVAAVGGRMDEKFTATPPDLWRAVHMPQHHGPQEQLNPRILFGSTMACRVTDVMAVGGWNERFITNFEDVDLSGRLKAAGYHLLYAPSCQAWHLRRDTVDSVLRGHWNWNYCGFEHCFTSIEQWLSTRPGLIWGCHRAFRVMDRQHPQIAPVSFLHPWGWLVRDLHALAGRVPGVGQIRDVAVLASGVLGQYGYDTATIERLRDWLLKLVDDLQGGHRETGRLHPVIAGNAEWMALESIPDLTYGRRCAP